MSAPRNTTPKPNKELVFKQEFRGNVRNKKKKDKFDGVAGLIDLGLKPKHRPYKRSNLAKHTADMDYDVND